MPWFRLEDSFHSHPKVIAAGNEATGLFVRCGTYAAEHLTDGFIPKSTALLYGSPALADTLVRVKLWHRARGGWTIHDYLDYNPSREAVENERKNAAERQRRRRGAMPSRRDSRRDTGVSHSTPSRPVDVNGSAVNQSADRNARASPDLIELITTEILAATGRHITEEWAQRTYANIVGARHVASPAAYIKRAIRDEPDPKKRFLPLY